MVENTKQVPTYKVGDTIRIQLDVSDPSGVADVSANFILRGPNSGDVTLHGHGGNKTRATVLLEKEVTEDIPPGEWTLFTVYLTDSLGNKSSAKADIQFRIEGAPGDHEGPKLEGWKVVDLTEEEMRLLRALYEQRSSQIRVAGETLALSANVEDYHRVSRRLVGDGYVERHLDDDGDEWLEITSKGVRKVQAA